jgi:hypothetical protein
MKANVIDIRTRKPIGNTSTDIHGLIVNKGYFRKPETMIDNTMKVYADFYGIPEDDVRAYVFLFNRKSPASFVGEQIIRKAECLRLYSNEELLFF